MSHTYHSGYGNETKIFELSMARRVRWYMVLLIWSLLCWLLAPSILVNILMKHAGNFTKKNFSICMLVWTKWVFAKAIAHILVKRLRTSMIPNDMVSTISHYTVEYLTVQLPSGWAAHITNHSKHKLQFSHINFLYIL